MGCHPFDGIARDVTVMYKVLKGERPDRPPDDGLSDQLWELLAATWLVEQASQPSKRPSTSIIRDRLTEDVRHQENWENPVAPPVPVRRGTCSISIRVNGVCL